MQCCKLCFYVSDADREIGETVADSKQTTAHNWSDFEQTLAFDFSFSSCSLYLCCCGDADTTRRLHQKFSGWRDRFENIMQNIKLRRMTTTVQVYIVYKSIFPIIPTRHN